VKHIPQEREDEQNPIPLWPLLRDDTKFAAGRIAFFQYVTVGAFLFLLSGFWRLQVQNQEEYSVLAQRNSVRSQPVPAPRGKLLDREGRVIVDNRFSFRLILSRENLKLEHLKPIAEGLHLDYDELLARVKRFSSRASYEAITIKENLTRGELAFVEAHRDAETFPEMELIPSQQRLFPKDGLAAHVIGYVGEISESELNLPEFARYDQGDFIGKAGIERQYNETLMGVDGGRRVVVDSRGNVRKVLDMKEAIPGHDLQLTIDLDLQVVAELAMQDRKGAVVALDPRNGEVLALVSRPAFDPSLFAGRISSKDWKELASNPDNPLLNRAIQAQLAPGSTFKPIMALAGYESGALDDSTRVHCAGSAVFYGRPFKCWQKKGHGNIDGHGALVHSCDVFFYHLGNRMGIDTIAEYADKVGLGHKTGIDLPHEAEGLVPSSKWKIRTAREKWYAGETISVAIGQGALTVTPIQMARAIGGIATGGVFQAPHLVKGAPGSERARKEDFDLENGNKVIFGMWGVVNEGGTGAQARLAGFDVCGKTGTAQLASNEFLKGSGKARDMKDNAWFVGFAPRQSPEIVVVALFEAGVHGNLAAPIVRDVLKAYYDKKFRKNAPGTEVARFGPGVPLLSRPDFVTPPRPERVEAAGLGAAAEER
jgi:penicillin-binding protein 2